MSANVVAKRYAEALFQLAEEQHVSNELVNEFQIVKKLFNDNADLLPFFAEPRIGLDQKKQFVDDVFKDFSRTLRNTIKLLCERHRIDIVPDMTDQLTVQVNEAQGIAEATIYSVRELSQEERVDLEKSLTKRFSKRSIKFTMVVNPSLLGGVKIRVGNTIIDGTISSKLQRIERNMKRANI